MSPHIYRSPQALAIQALHAQILTKQLDFPTVKDFLAALAHHLWQAHQAGHPAVAVQISNWHPERLGQSADEILARAFAPSDAQLTLAREMGWENWEEVEAEGKVGFDPGFEAAVDTLLAGDEEGLRQRLQAHPELASQRSPLGHRATLLHYAGSNGVETWRQQVPANLPTLVNLLRTAGADPRAEAQVYGQGHTALALAESSGHPAAAGVKMALLQALS